MKNHKHPCRKPTKVFSILAEVASAPDDTSQPRKDDSQPNIFARLEDRGIDYGQVKTIVQFDIPQNTLRFARWFRGKTIDQVLNQFEKWRTFLEKDFVLMLSSEVKAQLGQFVFGTEWMVWQALIEANPHVGPWDLRFRFLPTGHDENGRIVYIHPPIQFEAVHRETKKTRTARILGGKSLNPADLPAAYRKAFNDLGLWNEMWKGDPSRLLASNRQQHAWPLFTKCIIPRLYEFMHPYYHLRAHYSERLDADHSAPRRWAWYSKDLQQDMLDILKMEHKWAFEKATPRGLKAVIQRHLARKPAQTAPKS